MNDLLTLTLAILVIGICSNPLKASSQNIWGRRKNEVLDIYYWSPWSSCTKTCSGGITYREKFCLVDHIEDKYAKCGTNIQKCNDQPCNVSDEIKCPYMTNPNNKREFKKKSGDHEYLLCPERMHFNDSDTVCTCLPDSTLNCDKDLLLHLPFESHLGDVSCTVSDGVKVIGNVSLVNDRNRGMVAKFNGSGHLEVPFLSEFFTDNKISSLTMAYFFKITSSSGLKGKISVISNGLCERDTATFESGYNDGNVYCLGRTVTSHIATITSREVKVNAWYHVAWVYTGSTLTVYVNGEIVSKAAISGALINTDIPMAVGARCGEFFHTGLVDDVRIYTKALSARSIYKLYSQ